MRFSLANRFQFPLSEFHSDALSTRLRQSISVSSHKPTNTPIWKRIQDRLGVKVSKKGAKLVDDNGLPIPGAELRHAVAGNADLKWFINGGKLGVETIVSVLNKRGIEFGSLESVLDFGCGCGRVLRHLGHYENVHLHGTDISRPGIAWCDANLNFAMFGTNRLSPHTRYRTASFDFIYAFSVFTHLTQELQAPWMTEMRRLLKPGGHLLVTVHGEHYLNHLSQSEKAAFRNGKLVIKGGESVGSNHCAAFHPEKFVTDSLAPETGFKVVDFIPEGALGNPKQDAYLLAADA